jgi:hypothetical protein
MCVDRKFLEGRQRLIRNMGLVSSKDRKRKLDGMETKNDSPTKDDSSLPTLVALKMYARSINDLFEPADGHSEM